jgi:inosine-uridine nucleoside N-ribohydrolase
VHDACAVLAVTDPGLFEGRDVHVVVETAGEHTRGMTLVDRRPLAEMPTPNAHFLTQVDDDAAFELILDAVTASP